jgi:hypothetical protein
MRIEILRILDAFMILDTAFRNESLFLLLPGSLFIYVWMFFFVVLGLNSP